MTSREVKNALYARHPASGGQMPGAWTCMEEWRSIDFLAISAWSSIGGYARIGYEVKVSRGDLRSELLNPSKRARNVAWCNEFYLAVPRGLLTDAELAWAEPDWEPGDFVRTRCPYSRGGPLEPEWRADPGPCHKGKRTGRLVGPMPKPWGWDEGRASRGWATYSRPSIEYRCHECNGKGYVETSRVERDAPTLWVPRDVGLVVVDGRGTNLVKRSPRRRDVPPLSASELGQFVRWISIRPDPRHHPRPGPVPNTSSDVRGSILLPSE